MAKPPAPAPSPAALQAHIAACQQQERMYKDPDTGYFVMTSIYLKSKGKCCGSGCRHCPFDAAEQQRAQRPDRLAWPWPNSDA